MNAHILSIPDDSELWPSWLEEQIVGVQLSQVVDELIVLRSSMIASDNVRTLSSVLTPRQLTSVVDSGLKSLAIGKIQLLLRHAECLLELQEYVLSTDSEYWNQIDRPQDLADSVQQVRARLTKASPNSQAEPRRSVRPHRLNRRNALWTTTAALVAVVTVTLWPTSPVPSGRILGQPGLVVNDTSSSSEYLKRVAEAGREWFDLQPANSTELISLLEDVREDCQFLMDSDHQALTPGERDWFVAKCQIWQTAFDNTLAGLRSEQLTFKEGRLQADATMKQLIDALNTGPTV